MGTRLQKKVVISLFGKSRVFDDVALPLYHSLLRLGYDCSFMHNAWHVQATNILIGLSDTPGLDFSLLPEDSIIYNFEQLVAGSKGLYDNYLLACRHRQVWDYSLLNIKRFVKDYGITKVEHVPLGYSPEMTRLDPDYPKDIDVLFYGSINERRHSIIKELQARGINAIAVYDIYGQHRDILIARSHIVLNMHFYLPGIQEIVRLAYNWANKKCVVCECNSDSYIHAGYEESCLYAPYEQLCDTVCKALKQPALLSATGRTAFESFKAHDYTAILDALVGPAPGSAKKTVPPLPAIANIGSGKKFIPDAVNIDINARWRPDIVLDISEKLTFDHVYATERFGRIRLQKNMFKRILLYDVLEHVNDVCQAMTNLLDLLKEGGILDIHVPYDLSLGAWQDPTHRHAFNEKSWLYYTDWYWYVGWREARFDILDVAITLSQYGKTLEKNGADRDTLLRQPRAVDFMRVRLRKRATSFEEKTMYDVNTRAVYKTPQPDWITEKI